VRAEELCEQVGDKARMVDALLALSNVRHQRAEYQSARALVAQALALGEGVDDPRLVARARFHMGENFYWLGDFSASREHCEKALELFGSGPYRNFWEAENVRWSRFYAIVDTALLGYPDMARKRSGEALADARRSSDPVSVAMALQTEFSTYIMLRDMGEALERADEQLSIGTEYAMPLHTLLGAANRAWALAVQGRQTEESIAKLQTLEVATAGSKLVNNVLSFMRLDCYRSAERIEEGIELAAEILLSVQKDGLKWFDPQLYQIQGELLMRGSRVAEAQACFRLAIEMARDQKAKIWELRATTSLARLLAKQGRREEARSMLAEIYGWFTEGFDTADLKDARRCSTS
jgi:tetratricopeptide (TPR) repeat protein